METNKESDLMITIKSLQSDLEDLQSLYQTPRLNLSNYFINIRSEIDLALAKQSTIKTTKEIINKLNDNYVKMIELVNDYEQECFKQRHKNTFKPNESKQTLEAIQFIKDKIDYLIIKEREQDENQADNDEDFSLDIIEIENLIYDETFNLERIILLNKTMIFLEETTSKVENLFNKMDYLCTAGKLIFIKNEYFGNRGLNLISDKSYIDGGFAQRLTNETVKSIHLKQTLEANPTSNQIDELILNDEFYKLELSNRQIRSLATNTFSGLTKLEVINLDSNLIKSIDENLFHGLVNLKVLNLFKNKIQCLEPLTFRGLIYLKELHLRENAISVIDANLFNGLINLEIIYLFYNQIKYLDVNVFKGLINLKEVYLGGNRLETIDANLFNGLTNLKEIYLSHNQIKSIDCIKLSGLDNLQFIMLNNNCIQSISPLMFTGLSNLEKIWLNDNELTQIDFNLFNNLDNLKIVYLYNNKLKNDYLNIKLFNLSNKETIIYFD